MSVSDNKDLGANQESQQPSKATWTQWDYSSSLIFPWEKLTPILFEKEQPRISANLGESHSVTLALTNLRFVRGIRQRSAECWFALPALTESRRLKV